MPEDASSATWPLLTFATSHESPLVRVEHYVCRSGPGGPGGEEFHTQNAIVLMRHGVFCKHLGRHSLTADVNQAIFFSRGSAVRVSHPGECGDRGTVLTVTPWVLNDIIRELDPSVDDRPDQPFPFVTGPSDFTTFSRHRELVQRLESPCRAPCDPLWADTAALQLSGRTIEAAYAQSLSNRPRRTKTAQDHADRVEAAKAYLARSIGERITLDHVARAVHTSPFHFTRIFHQRAGLPVHKYLTRLRLRTSLERLAEGADDLALLALDLGFSSHSHFTDAFRREFGRTPSDVRGATSPKALRQMSKNLEV